MDGMGSHQWDVLTDGDGCVLIPCKQGSAAQTVSIITYIIIHCNPLTKPKKQNHSSYLELLV